jgi:hypothetical protein
MKNYNPAYYLLFMLLVFGAFASMAQNDYGIKILGLVAMAFSILFFIQFIRIIQNAGRHWLDVLELGSLVVLSSIMAMRVYYIRFSFVEVVFGMAGFTLMLTYVIKNIQSWNNLKQHQKMLAILVGCFYGSLVLYIMSMVTVPFFPVIAVPAGVAAFILFLLFILQSYLRNDLLLEGEKITGFSYVLKFKDRSVVLLSLFVLFTAYMGLTKVDLLPEMYSDEYPQAYYELVKQAETGKEKRVNGKFKHELFKERYDQFVSRHDVTE